jgi:hypothetical protein
MEVREKDLTALALHMYNKATIMGDCLDELVSKRKASSKKVVGFDAKRCVEDRVKFMSWYQTRRRDNSSFERMFEGCVNTATLHSQRKPEPAYSFLKIEVQPLFHAEYATVKRCYDQNQIFKQLD